MRAQSIHCFQNIAITNCANILGNTSSFNLSKHSFYYKIEELTI
jgi:hypothetical protein